MGMDPDNHHMDRDMDMDLHNHILILDGNNNTCNNNRIRACSIINIYYIYLLYIKNYTDNFILLKTYTHLLV